MNSASAANDPVLALDDLCINTLRFLSVDAVQKANSGHPGLPLGAAPIAWRVAIEARDQPVALILTRQNVATLERAEYADADGLRRGAYVLAPSIRARLAVEAGVMQGWHRYVGDQGDVLGLDRFGASAPGNVLLREFGFTVENVCKRALAVMR